jgi:processive 1,2-diacylglycerol beta-glucosyltransferase
VKPILVLPEFWSRNYIGACGWIRLLEPLLTPEIASEYRVSCKYSAEDLEEEPEVVIFERLWHPKDVRLLQWHSMLRTMKRKGTRIIYSLDDNLADYTVYQESEWFSSVHLSVINLFIHYADVVVVSTKALQQKLAPIHKNIELIPNAIDPHGIRKNSQADRLTKFGYLASPDHRDYLYSILEPLRNVLYRFQDRVEFEIIGLPDFPALRNLFPNLRVDFRMPPSTEYRKYIPWLMDFCDWDFGIAPIVRNDFTRCKSDMKFLDHTRLGIPGIYSDFTPFEEVRLNHAGLVVKDDWEAAIASFIEDPGKRREYLDSAIDYVSRERTLARQVSQWKTLLSRIIS